MHLPAGLFNTSYSEDMAISRTKLQWALTVLGLLLLFSFPAFASNYVLRLLMSIAVAIIAVHGVNILTGFCGQISIGHAAFVAIGGYTSGILATDLGWPFWICLPIAGVMAGAIGVFFGLSSLRVKGFYLALATLAAQFIIQYAKIHVPDLTGGVYGLTVPYPQLGGIIIDSPQSQFFLVIILTIIMTAFAKNLSRTRTGRAFIAIRDNDIAAEVMGVSLFRYKLLAFFIGCFYAGIAGSVWAHTVGAISPQEHGLMDSIWYIGMIIVGGMGSTTGAIFGATFIKLLEEVITLISPIVGDILPQISGQFLSSAALIVNGIVVVLFLVFEPRGLAHRWELFKSSYRLWPFSY